MNYININEGILNDIDDTIKNGDELLSGEADFKKIKKLIANENNWNIRSNLEYINVYFEASAPYLCKALGLNNINEIAIKGAKFKYHSSFKVNVIFKNPDDKTFINNPRFNINCSGRTPTLFIFY